MNSHPKNEFDASYWETVDGNHKSGALLNNDAVGADFTFGTLSQFVSPSSKRVQQLSDKRSKISRSSFSSCKKKLEIIYSRIHTEEQMQYLEQSLSDKKMAHNHSRQLGNSPSTSTIYGRIYQPHNQTRQRKDKLTNHWNFSMALRLELRPRYNNKQTNATPCPSHNKRSRHHSHQQLRCNFNQRLFQRCSFSIGLCQLASPRSQTEEIASRQGTGCRLSTWCRGRTNHRRTHGSKYANDSFYIRPSR